jgi:hypothetical protein
MAQMVVDIDLPAGAQSISFDFKFLSEEFPEFVNSAFNDGFVVEVGTTTFTVSGVDIIAPDNVVFDQNGDLVSINTTGELGFTGDDPEETDLLEGSPLTGTTYDGGTPVITTTVPIPAEEIANGTVRLIFSVFDVGDNILDSAVFLDDFKIGSTGGDGPSTGIADNTPPVCSGSLDGDTFFGTVADALTDDPDNSGVASVSLGPVAENLVLTVNPFEPGAESVSYTVGLIDPTLEGSGSVVGTDGDNNTCQIPVGIPAQQDGTVDTTPPICADIELEFDGPGGAISAVNTAASDPESGIASATFTTLQNLSGFVGGFGPFVEGDVQSFDAGSTSSIDIRGERISYTAGGAIVVTVENGAGLTSDCDPVVEQISASIPERSALLGNYPNPAVGSTTIEVRVAEPGPVRLEVYDLLGRKVSTLIDREMMPGTYQVEWTRSETAQLASGTYIYRLAAGSVTESRRLTLLR